MCEEADVGGKWISSIGDLAAALRIRPDQIVLLKGYPPDIVTEADGRMCLCPVNMRATAKAAGMKVRQDAHLFWKFTSAAGGSA